MHIQFDRVLSQDHFSWFSGKNDDQSRLYF